MVINNYVKCSTCSTKFRLRIQVANRDIKFSFSCPKCNTILSGKYVFKNGSDEKNTKNNCSDYYPKKSEHGINNAEYVQELSAEFMQKKLEVDSFDKTKLDSYITPFMRTIQLLGEENIGKISEKESYLFRYESYANDLILIEDLYINKKFDLLQYKLTKGNLQLIELLKNTLPKDFKFICKNELDMITIIHQARNILITNLLDLTRKSNVLNAPLNFTSIISKINLVDPLIKHLGDKGYFYSFHSRMVEVTRDYGEILPYLIPLITAVDYYSSVLKSGEYIISIEIFRDITSLYQKMFELFCDGIDLIIGLNNIFERGSYDSFFMPKKNMSTFEEVINSYGSKFLKYTEQLKNEKFTGGLLDILSNVIRNSEGHFDRTYDFDKNEVVFKNKHKGSEKIHRVDYVTFISDFIMLFNATNELFEYCYQMEKVFLIRCKSQKPSYGRK